MMQRSTVIAALAGLGLAASASAASNDLESRVTARDGWVAYSVPMFAGADGPCCFSVNKGTTTQKGCDLDQRRWSFDSDDGDPAAAEGALAVYLKVAKGRIERVRAVGSSCPVHTATAVRWVDPVEPATSVAMLTSFLDRNTGDAQEHSLMALAYHADASAMRALAARAEPTHSFKVREQALFWLGQIRGAEGAGVIQRYAAGDPNPKLRAKAIFALSQSNAPNAYDDILKIARNDSDDEVRGEAFFWLVQTDDPRAKNDVIASLRAESSSRVQDEAVFALSQLDDGAADDALISVVRGDFPRAVKKQAMFWLGQSGSPRAMAYFEEALE